MDTDDTSTVLGESSDPKLFRRDNGLADVPLYALNQLTSLLCMGDGPNVTTPDRTWLKKQKEQIATIDRSLRSPKKVLERVALQMGNNLPFLPQVARLCHWHSGLDPRVVRNLGLLLANEATSRADRFRRWRMRSGFPQSVSAWLGRVDSTVSLWVPPDVFKILLGYQLPAATSRCIKSGCEACIVSVMGGRPQLLSDLRAGLLVRKYQNARKGRPEPRLLRVVDSWISHFSDECCIAVLKASEALSQDLLNMEQGIKRRKEKRRTPHKLISAQEARKARHHKRAREEVSQPIAAPEEVDDDERVSNRKEDMSGEDAAREAWSWLESHAQGLTDQQRYSVVMGVHPIFGEYQSPSAMPSPLRLPDRSGRKEGDAQVAGGLEEGDEDGSYFPAGRLGDTITEEGGEAEEKPAPASLPSPPSPLSSSPPSVWTSHVSSESGVSSKTIKFQDPWEPGVEATLEESAANGI